MSNTNACNSSDSETDMQPSNLSSDTLLAERDRFLRQLLQDSLEQLTRVSRGCTQEEHEDQAAELASMVFMASGRTFAKYPTEEPLPPGAADWLRVLVRNLVNQYLHRWYVKHGDGGDYPGLNQGIKSPQIPPDAFSSVNQDVSPWPYNIDAAIDATVIEVSLENYRETGDAGIEDQVVERLAVHQIWHGLNDRFKRAIYQQLSDEVWELFPEDAQRLAEEQAHMSPLQQRRSRNNGYRAMHDLRKKGATSS